MNRQRCALTTLLLGVYFAPSVMAGPPSPPSQAAIRGTVVAADGRPSPGIAVFLTQPGGVAQSRGVASADTTDAAGRFRLIRGVSEDSIVIAAPKDGALAFASGQDSVIVRLGDPTEARIPFVDENGAPLADREVAVFPVSDTAPLDGTFFDLGFPNLPEGLKSRLTGRTDARGVLTLTGLPRGVRVGLTILAGESFPLVLKGSVQLGNGPLSEVPPVRVVRSGTLMGRVTIRRTGRPIPNVSVQLVGPGYHNFMGTARTNADGRYRFTGLTPAAYFVMMQDSKVLGGDEHTGERVYQPLARTKAGKWLLPYAYAQTPVAAGEQVSGIDFALVASATVITKVIGSAGRPLFGAQVTVWLPDGSGEGRSTGLDGSCRIQAPPGPVRVSLSRDHSKGEQRLTLAEGETRTVLFAPPPDRQTGPQSGRALAPDFTAQDAQDHPIRLSSLRGHVIVLAFWFPGENREILAALKHTNAVVQRTAPRGVVGLAVDTNDGKEPFDAWRTQHPGLTALRFVRDTSDRHVTGEGAITTRYRVSGWPLVFVIGPEGTLRERFEGACDEATLERAVTEAQRTPATYVPRRAVGRVRR